MATPSLAMIPSAFADSKVYSVLPNNGDGDFTFNRDSSATRVGQNGLIQEVGFFGSELVNSWTNNDFSSFASNGSNITQMVSSGSGNNCFSLATFTSGKTYELKFTSSQNITAQVRISPNTSLTSAQVVLTNPTSGSNSIKFTATSNYSHIGFFANSSFTDTQITEFIAREIQGDQPRLNYDISNGVVQSCPSLLLEPASTNLIIQSNQFNTSWSTNAVTLQDNQSGVSGGLNAWKMTEDTSTGQHFVQLPSSLTAGSEQTVTIYAKADERNFLMLNQSGVFRTHYDLVNGTVVSIGTGVTASMESMPDGWWRCIYTATMTNTSLRVCVSNDGSSSTYTGDGVSGIYIQYCQNETLSFATSYIPTSGQSGGVTRAAETCFGAGTAATFNDSEGVLYAELSGELSGTNRYITLSNSAISDRVNIFFDANNDLRAFVNGISSISGGVAIQGTNKCAFKYKSGDIAFWVNGIEVGTRTATLSLTGLSQVSFNLATGFNVFYGNCKDIRVYNEALTDAQLQTLTTL